MEKIVIVGVGNIGKALLSGLLKGGISPDALTGVNRSERSAQAVHEEFGIDTTTHAEQAIQGADYIFLCVKPYAIAEVARQIAGSVSGHTPVIISLASGVSLDELSEAVDGKADVVRVMPNTPMLVGKGVSGISFGEGLSEQQQDYILTLMRMTGTAVEIPESKMDALTAVSGSAPAYFYLVIEAMMDAGVNLGLTRDLSQQLAVGTMEGAAAMLQDSTDGPTELRARVTSPGGTTSAATRKLEENGIRQAFFEAMQACYDKSAGKA